MTNTDEAPTLKSRGGAYVLYGVIALVLYVLSVGPAHRLCEMGYLPHEVYGIIYMPLATYTRTLLFSGSPSTGI